MASDQANNQGENWSPNEDDRAVEQAFLQLGHVLGEIAWSSSQPEEGAASHSKGGKGGLITKPQKHRSPRAGARGKAGMKGL